MESPSSSSFNSGFTSNSSPSNRMRTSLSPSSFPFGCVFDGTVPAILLAGVGKEFIAGCCDCCVDVATEDGGVVDSCDTAAADDVYAVEEGDACC
jgi:hypothetical protein